MKPSPPPPHSDISLPPFNPGAPETVGDARPGRLIPDPEADGLVEPDDSTGRDELPDVDFEAPLRP